ncbi:MAG: hypothetical protein ACFCGT_00350 [Sandaracinaceae bacterium]
MRADPTTSALALAILALSGCDFGERARAEVACEDLGRAIAALCGDPCGPGGDCPDGLYCGAGDTCTADCVPGSCPDGRACSADGRCVSSDAGPAVDSGPPPDMNTVCANVEVDARRVTPTVILVVDQSGSMSQGFGDTNRWNALKDSLLASPDGFIAALEDQVRFGLALYSARSSDNENIDGECPVITIVEPALSNFSAIDDVYAPANPIDETPTGESIDALLDRLALDPDPDPDPTVFVLCTDGEPDTCAQPNPQRGQPEALAAVERAFDLGVRTFVISLANERELSSAHLQDVANAGLGRRPGDEDAPFWRAGDDDGLRDALRTIIGGELSCELELDGRIVGDPCLGQVRLNGVLLECNGVDGWRALDDTRIELLGEACETLKTAPGVGLEAEFPCDVVILD